MWYNISHKAKNPVGTAIPTGHIFQGYSTRLNLYLTHKVKWKNTIEN